MTFDKHNDDFMADGLNTLRNASVFNWYGCFGFSVANVAEFLCSAVEKLLFFSEAQSQYLRQLPKKPILLECWARNLLVCAIQTKTHKKSIGISLFQSKGQASVHTRVWFGDMLAGDYFK